MEVLAFEMSNIVMIFVKVLIVVLSALCLIGAEAHPLYEVKVILIKAAIGVLLIGVLLT